MKTKKCFRCTAVLPLTDFYPHPETADGYLNKCRECAKADVRENYAKRRARYAAYDAEREQRPERKIAKLRQAKIHRARNPEKARVRSAVAYAVRSGKLKKQPCFHCGATENIHGHHRDYLKPLEVVWCCPRCHVEIEHGKHWTDPKDRVKTKASRWDKKRSSKTRNPKEHKS